MCDPNIGDVICNLVISQYAIIDDTNNFVVICNSVILLYNIIDPNICDVICNLVIL